LIADYQIVTFVILLVICSLATAFIVGLFALAGHCGMPEENDNICGCQLFDDYWPDRGADF